MKDYESDSPIVERVREARKKVWAEYGNDVHQMLEAKRQDEESQRKQGRKFADDLQPYIPEDFEERLQRLGAQGNHGSAAA